MNTLFPMFPELPEERAGELPLYTDAAWDYEAGRPVFAGGEPVTVSGLEAVKSWAWRALRTERYRHSAFSWDYGCELAALAGQPYREDTKLQEARRYVAEALTVCPYIKAATVTETSFSGDTLHLTVELETVYGKETVYV